MPTTEVTDAEGGNNRGTIEECALAGRDNILRSAVS